MPAEPLVLALAIVLDLGLGDPPNAIHPVAWLGRLAGALRARLPLEGRAFPFVAGLLLVLLCLAAAELGGLALVRGASALSPLLGILASAFVLKSCFALRGLIAAARALVEAHRSEGLEAARARLSWLCSRDPAGLDASGLANGTIESLAENLSDSVVAPLFFYVVLGLPGAIAYRVVNTLDAMVGYRGRYEWLGKPAAWLDDLLNLLPARLTAWLLWLAGALVRARSGEGLRVYRRDRGLPESPNAGHPMAMAAGLLGLRLDKPGVYVLGAELPAPTLDDVARATRLVGVAGGLAFACALGGTVLRAR